MAEGCKQRATLHFPRDLCKSAPLESGMEKQSSVIVLGWCECLLAFGESSSLSPSGHLWPSQLISGPGHPAPPFAAPVLRRLAAGIPGGRALLLILRLHHALAVGSPHGFCLLSLLSEGGKGKRWVKKPRIVISS